MCLNFNVDTWYVFSPGKVARTHRRLSLYREAQRFYNRCWSSLASVEFNAVHIAWPMLRSRSRTLPDSHSKGVRSMWEVWYQRWLLYVLELQYEDLKDVLAQFSCSYPFKVVVVPGSTEVVQQMLVLCCER